MAKINFSETLTLASDKVSRNIYLQSISQGCMSMLPVVIIGSFASLFSGLPVNFWQNFIQSTGISGILAAVVSATTNMLGVFFTYGVASAYAEKLKITNKVAVILALVVYIALLPTATLDTGTTTPSTSYMGTSGMIVGFLLAFLTVRLYKAIVDANIVIKMPAGTPDYVSNTFVSLIPGFIVVIAAMILRGLFSLTPWGNIFDCLYNLLQIPLTALIGSNVISQMILQIIGQVCWALGIHPGFLTSATGPIMFGLDGMNQAAYAAGQPIPNIIGMAFSYSMTIAVLYPAFALVVLIFSKSNQLKTVGKISIAPAFFGISEPLMFGVPVVMNPFMAIPWIISPTVNVLLGWLACSSGLVARYAGVTVFNFPMGVTGILNGSFTIAILEVVVCIIDILIFMPFVRIQDKKYLAEEKAAAEAEQ